MQAQQISLTKSSPNPRFNNYCDCDFPQIESSTLAIGHECLDSCEGDAQKAVDKFQNHKIEIMLTTLHNLITAQKNPNDEVFKQVLEFIQIEDGA